MIKNEIQYNVGNLSRQELMEEFGPYGLSGMKKRSVMVALEAESRILRSITELARNIKNLEFSIKDMETEKKNKLFASIKEKLEVLNDVLKELKPEEKKETEEEE